MPVRILIAGGGYVGMYTALVLERRLRPEDAELVLVNPESFMTYQPFLPEAAAGTIEPRHVVVPLRTVLRRTRVVTGDVVGIDHERRTAALLPVGADPYELSYDHVVVAPGSVSRVAPIPGLAEHGIGFKSVAEAIYLRNRVLSRLDLADSVRDLARRRRALTFVFVGGGYAGVEALAELEDLARDAARYYPTVRRADMRWVLVEATGRILPEIGEELGQWALDYLRGRGIEVHLDTLLESAEDGVIRLSDGTLVEADTLVWTAGVRPHPLVAASGLPLDDRGRLVVDAFLRVSGSDAAWSAGDCAAVPDLAAGGTSPPTAQHALRQAKRLGANLAAAITGGPMKPFRYRSLGGLASLGRYQGVARVLSVGLRGFPAWLVHRSYHVSRIPTFNRKVRVVMDWSVGLFFRRDVVQLGSLTEPREPFLRAAGRAQ